MSVVDSHGIERQNLFTRLLDSVKQCQVRFGGKSELASDGDSRVTCLCATWEATLQHGMKHGNKALSTLKQMTEMTGLTSLKGIGMLEDIRNMETEPAFWQYVKEHLSKHEIQRYTNLKNINTDAGRGRAWLRAAINEHSLEKYMHMLIENEVLIGQFYEEWAFIRDQERSSMLPTVAAGLGSILFAIKIDNEELNAIKPASGLQISLPNTPQPVRAADEPRPVIAGEGSPTTKKREKKKKKKIAHIVSFDDDDSSVTSSPISLHPPASLPSKFTEQAMPGAQGTDIHSLPTEIKSDSSPPKTSIESATVQLKELEISSNNSFTLATSNSETVSISSIPEQGVLLSSAERQEKKHSPDVARLRQTQEDSFDSVGSHGVSRSPSQTSYSSMEIEMGMFGGNGGTPATLTPVTPVGGAVTEPIMVTMNSTPQSQEFRGYSKSVDSGSDVPAFSMDTENAAFALAMVQKGLVDSQGSRTQGDGSHAPEPASPRHETMTTAELKQAVVAMMLRKDEVEEQNRSLRSLLEREMETAGSLRAEMDEITKASTTKQEKDTSKIAALQRENELLKHQLKKYVSAVQMLRREGNTSPEELPGIQLEDPQPAIPPAKPSIDYSYEASEYQRQLVQMAEMDGELIEFNSMLVRQLNSKESLIRRLKQELTDLRGPLPQDLHNSDDAASISSDFESSSHPLINIWIPSAFLRGASSDAYHVYQIYIRIKDEEWNVYRRYTQFYELHNKLKKKNSIVNSFGFPPKKVLGSKDTKFVEERRRKLQKYTRNVINLLNQNNSDLASNASKAKLIEVMPFFGEEPAIKKDKKRKAVSGRPVQSPTSREAPTNQAQADHYTGL